MDLTDRAEILYQKMMTERQNKQELMSQSLRKRAELYYRAFFDDKEPLTWTFTNEIVLRDNYLKFVDNGRYPYFLLSKRCIVCRLYGYLEREIRSMKDLGLALHDRSPCVLHPSETS